MYNTMVDSVSVKYLYQDDLISCYVQMPHLHFLTDFYWIYYGFPLAAYFNLTL